MLKRIICTLLIIMLLPCSSFAQEIIFHRVSAERTIPLGGALLEKGEELAVEASNSVSFFGVSTLEEYISEYILSAETLPTVIDGLGQFNIKKDDFADIYYDIALKNPELLLVTSYSSCKYDAESLVVQSIVPKYMAATMEDANTARAELTAGVKEYTDIAKSYTSDLEKLLVIHDKMIAECDYDVRAMDETTIDEVPDSARHAIGVFKEERAVCQGYSQALYMIAKELQIEMDFCYSEEKNHMWNYVKLDGKWYHLDLTNNDPAEEDENGNNIARVDTRAWHLYFLVSDSGLDSAIHGSDGRSFSGNTYTCNDTKYETDHLFNILEPFTAQRAEDGFFHLPVEVEFEYEGVSETIDLKSETLYTGPSISQYCMVKGAKTGRNLYFVNYPTKEIKNTVLYVRHDNMNQIKKFDTIDCSADVMWGTHIATNVPEDIDITFSAFLWDADTLVPYSMKTVWTQ